MITLDDYQELKRKIDYFVKEKEKVAARFEITREQIQKEFGCTTKAEVTAKLKSMLEQSHQMAEKYNKAKEAFWERWGDTLEKYNEPPAMHNLR